MLERGCSRRVSGKQGPPLCLPWDAPPTSAMNPIMRKAAVGGVGRDHSIPPIQPGLGPIFYPNSCSQLQEGQLLQLRVLYAFCLEPILQFSPYLPVFHFPHSPCGSPLWAQAGSGWPWQRAPLTAGTSSPGHLGLRCLLLWGCGSISAGSLAYSNPTGSLWPHSRAEPRRKWA